MVYILKITLYLKVLSLFAIPLVVVHINFPTPLDLVKFNNILTAKILMESAVLNLFYLF